MNLEVMRANRGSQATNFGFQAEIVMKSCWWWGEICHEGGESGTQCCQVYGAQIP